MRGHLTTAWLKWACPHLTPCGIATICRASAPAKPDGSGAPAAAKRTPCSLTVCSYDAFAQMRPIMRFHASDDITRDEGAPISRRHRAWHIRGCHHVEYTDGDILPALPETMTMRESRPLSHVISDPQEIMAGYPSFYDLTPHPR